MSHSASQIKQIAAITNKSGTGSISSADYRSIMLGKSSTAKNKTPKSSNYSFTFTATRISNYEIKFTLAGRHESTNVINGGSFRKKLVYKNAIKKAAYEYFLQYRNEYRLLVPDNPYENCTILPISYNPKSRDDDGNSVTLKTIRDILTEYKFIKDDSRKYLKQLPNDEVISKEYKIELILTNLNYFEASA